MLITRFWYFPELFCSSKYIFSWSCFCLFWIFHRFQMCFERFQDKIYLQAHHKVYNMYKNCTKTFQWRNKATILDNVTSCPVTPGMRSHPQEWELERCTTNSQWPKTWNILFRYRKHNIIYYNGIRSRHDPTVFPESDT